MKMDDDEDYTFSSAALKNRRRAQRLRSNNTGGGATDDADGGAHAPQSPSKILSPRREARRAARRARNGGSVASRIKQFNGGVSGGHEETPGIVRAGSSGDSSHHSQSNGSSSVYEEEVVSEYEISGSINQEQSEEVYEYEIAGSANQLDANTSEDTEVEYVDEHGEPINSPSYDEEEVIDEEDDDYMDVEDGEENIPDYADDDDSSGPLDAIEKYSSYLTRGTTVEKSWKKPRGKLGSAPDLSFDDDYGGGDYDGAGHGGSMFGGASKFGDTQSYADRAKEMIAKLSEDGEDKFDTSAASSASRQQRQQIEGSPTSDSNALSSEDMSELKSMLSINSGSDETESSTAKDDYLFGMLMKDKAKPKPATRPQPKKQKQPYQTYTTTSKYAMDSSDDEDEFVDLNTTESTLGLGSPEDSYEEESYVEEEEELDEEELERQAQYQKAASKPFNPMGSFSDATAARKVVAESTPPESPVPQSSVTSSVPHSPASSQGKNDRDPIEYKPESPRKKSDKTPISLLTNAANAQIEVEGASIASPASSRRQPTDVLASVAQSYVDKKESEDEEEQEEDLKEFLDKEIEGHRQGSARSEEEDNFSELWSQSVATELKDVPQPSASSLNSSIASESFRGKETPKKAPRGPAARRPFAKKPPIQEPPSSDSSNTSHSSIHEEEKREIKLQHRGERNSSPQDLEQSLRLGDNDHEGMDSFSLGASNDLEEDDSERYDRPEYNPQRARKNNNNEESFEGSLSIGGGMHSSGDIMNDRGESSEEESYDRRDESNNNKPANVGHDDNLNPRPGLFTAVIRHICRAIVTVFILGAIGVPLYFLIVQPLNEPTTKDIPNLELFEPFGDIPGLSPVQPIDPGSGSTPPSPLIPAIPGPPVGTPAPQSFILITPQPTPRPSLRTTIAPTPFPGPPIASSPLSDLLLSVSPRLRASLGDPTTPQAQAFQWLSNDTNLGLYSDLQTIQRFALATFYYSTNGDDWTRNDGWLSDDDECTWFTSSTNLQPCNETGSFVNLELDLNNLGGTLPPELAMLAGSLVQLELSRFGSSSFIGGTIPPEYGSLTLLEYLSLRGNELSGQLPTELGQLQRLDSIDLSENLLSGTLPEETGSWSQVSILDVGSNRFSGPLPTSLGRLPKLRSLFLSNNLFTGPLPAELGRLFLLENLDLENNGITSIPTEIGRLVLSRSLSLAKNNLVGTIPTEIGGLVNLLSLDLGENQLSGTIPSQIGNLFLVRGTSCREQIIGWPHIEVL